MSKIVEEVLAANQRYASDFGAKGQLALPPASGFAILELLDTREWFVIHHTGCGMELFTDGIISDLRGADSAAPVAFELTPSPAWPIFAKISGCSTCFRGVSSAMMRG
jgi:carbonic anhydrase